MIDNVRDHKYFELEQTLSAANIPLVRWFGETFEFNTADAEQLNVFDIGQYCSKATINDVRWFFERFPISRARFCSRKSLIFNFTCYAGRIDIAKWMISYFNLERKDVVRSKSDDRRGERGGFDGACRSGHLGFAKWFADTFQLTADDVQLFQDCAYRGAHKNEHWEVSLWIVETYGLSNYKC